MSLGTFSAWLSSTDISHAIKVVSWIIPTVQTIHIMSIAVVFSAALLVNLRIWQLVDKASSIETVAKRHLPAIWPGLIVLALTGTILIIGEPQRSLQNISFFVKMACIAGAIFCTLVLQQVTRKPIVWEASIWRKWLMRGLALLSTIIWLAVIFAGRWIAYSQV
jgi:hypothetical protein